MTDAKATEALSTYRIVRVQKLDYSPTGDEAGAIEPWNVVQVINEDNLSQKDIKKSLKAVGKRDGDNIQARKAELSLIIQRQIDKATNNVKESEDDERYDSELVQFEVQLREVEVAVPKTGSKENSKDKHGNGETAKTKDKKKDSKGGGVDKKSKSSKQEAGGSRSTKTKTKWERAAVILYYRRFPKPQQDIVRLYNELRATAPNTKDAGPRPSQTAPPHHYAQQEHRRAFQAQPQPQPQPPQQWQNPQRFSPWPAAVNSGAPQQHAPPAPPDQNRPFQAPQPPPAPETTQTHRNPAQGTMPAQAPQNIFHSQPQARPVPAQQPPPAQHTFPQQARPVQQTQPPRPVNVPPPPPPPPAAQGPTRPTNNAPTPQYIHIPQPRQQAPQESQRPSAGVCYRQRAASRATQSTASFEDDDDAIFSDSGESAESVSQCTFYPHSPQLSTGRPRPVSRARSRTPAEGMRQSPGVPRAAGEYGAAEGRRRREGRTSSGMASGVWGGRTRVSPEPDVDNSEYSYDSEESDLYEAEERGQQRAGGSGRQRDFHGQGRGWGSARDGRGRGFSYVHR